MEQQQESGNGVGPGFPKSAKNPSGYSKDERDRKLRGKDKAGTGRKGNDGFEEVIKLPPIKEACSEMMKAYKKSQAANEAFNDCIKKVAERSNTNASNLKRLVKASAKGNYADVRRDIDQQSVLFESIGEIPGGKVSEAA